MIIKIIVYINPTTHCLYISVEVQVEKQKPNLSDVFKVKWPLEPDWIPTQAEQQVVCLLQRLDGLNLWPPYGLSRPRRQDEKVVSLPYNNCKLHLSPHSLHPPSPSAPPRSSFAIWKLSALLHIFLWRDMKWAHIINISILFHCSPNKSCCSNKCRAPLGRLPLSGFELLMLQLAIYYRHLSPVTDKPRDGCMTLLCQNGFISHTPSYYLKWPDELIRFSSEFLTRSLFLFSFSSLRWRPPSHFPKSPFHQQQMCYVANWFSPRRSLRHSFSFLSVDPEQLACVHLLQSVKRSNKTRTVFFGASGQNIWLSTNPAINHVN